MVFGKSAPAKAAEISLVSVSYFQARRCLSSCNLGRRNPPQHRERYFGSCDRRRRRVPTFPERSELRPPRELSRGCTGEPRAGRPYVRRTAPAVRDDEQPSLEAEPRRDDIALPPRRPRLVRAPCGAAAKAGGAWLFGPIFCATDSISARSSLGVRIATRTR